MQVASEEVTVVAAEELVPGIAGQTYRDVLSGGLASGTVASGGNLNVFAGGTARGGEAISGGDAFIFAGGSAANLIAGSGGFGFVLSGATLSGATMSGGFLDVKSGASASGIVAFGSAGGTFELDEALTYGLTLAGFGVPGAIDFAAVAFGSSTSATYTSTGIGLGPAGV